MIAAIMLSLLRFLVLFSIAFSIGYGSQSESFHQRDFGFGAMEIFQFKNDTSYLTVRDMNGDGLDDIIFLNNKASRLEILVRIPAKSPGEGFPRLTERFIDRGVVLDQWVKTFQVADVNGDRRPDILTVGDRLGLVIYTQEEDGSFGEPLTRGIEDTAGLVNLVAADLDNDSYTDILLCRKENAEILRNNGKGEFKTHTLLPFSSGGCQGAMAMDINGDNLRDLLFYLGGEANALRVRMAIGKGTFGWEESLPLPPLRSLRGARLAGEKNPQLAVILKNGLILRLYAFEIKRQGLLLDQVEVLPQRLPLMGIGRKDTPAWVTGDFNKDGYDDFCAAAPLLSQVQLYMGSAAGLHPVPQPLDSLTAIKKMALTSDGDLVVFSMAEKAIALHQRKNLARFPLFFKAPGKPAAMAVSKSKPAVVFGVFKDNDFYLHLFDPAKPASGPIHTHKLSIANAPEGMKVFSLGGKNHWLVMLFMAYERPVAYQCQLQEGKLTLSPLQPERFRALGLNLDASSVTAVGSKDKPVLLVNEGKVARLYRWERNRFLVERQLNPRRESVRLSAAGLFPGRGNKSGYLVYDESGQDLTWFPAAGPGKGKKSPIPIHFRGGLKEIVGLVSLRLKDRVGLLLVGPSEMQWFLEGTDALTLKTAAEYTSRAERPGLWAVFPAVLGSPGRKMLALLDADNRSIELVGFEPKKRELIEQLVFEVFQAPGFLEPAAGYEPHGFGTGDFNGDSIQDMAVLVHDKLIIYLGE